jgi:gliding motility-associated peptidyl-prolyl isomerase
MKIMRFALIVVLLLSNFSCTENNARFPLNKKKQVFLNSSAERNKILLARDEALLKKATERDTTLNFMSSQAGFLYAYVKQAPTTLSLPQKGTRVRFQYQVEDLENNLLYSKSELGTVEYAVDQEDLLPALREGIRMMRPGEVVVFLFPSYLCYGYQGDGEKIGVNQPLRFTLERLPIN